jgi:hypothetical protein
MLDAMPPMVGYLLSLGLLLGLLGFCIFVASGRDHRSR